MLTTGVVNLLLQQTAITSLVAGSDAVMPIPAPVDMSQYPCIVYQVASDLPQEYTLDGPARVNDARIVFDCLAPYNNGGYGVARALALAIKKTLSGYKGTLSDGTLVYVAKIVNATDGFQSDSLLNRSSVHVMFTYQA